MTKKRRPKQTHSKLVNIHNSGKEGISGGNLDVLASMFRLIMFEIGADDMTMWNLRMHEYICDMRNAIPRNKKDQASARGNLQKELLKNEMSWNVFMKGMRFLDFSEIELIINAKHRATKQVSIHRLNINLGERVIIPTPELEEMQATTKPKPETSNAIDTNLGRI